LANLRNNQTPHLPFLHSRPAATSLTVIAAVTTGAPGCAIGEIKREQMKILGLGRFSDCRSPIAVDGLPVTDRPRPSRTGQCLNEPFSFPIKRGEKTS
jgi:hypothetical protein